MLGEGTLQARYIRGAFDDKPFTLGKYESVRIRVAIAELAANGGAPMGFYTGFEDPEARREIVRYYGFLRRYESLYRANRPHAEVLLLFPRSRVHEGDVAAVGRFKELGKRLLDAHVLFDVLPDDRATAAVRKPYAVVIDPADAQAMADKVIERLPSDRSRFDLPPTVRVSASRPAAGNEITLHFVNYNREEPADKKNRGSGIKDEKPIAAPPSQADMKLDPTMRVSRVEFLTPEVEQPQELEFEQTGAPVFAFAFRSFWFMELCGFNRPSRTEPRVTGTRASRLCGRQASRLPRECQQAGRLLAAQARTPAFRLHNSFAPIIREIACAAAVLLIGYADAAEPATSPPAKKVAAIVTVYHHNSHADVIVSRLLQTDTLDGKGNDSPLTLASLYTDQRPEKDISRLLAASHRFRVSETIEDALTLGTGRLAVDGVLLIAEHGEYPKSALGNTVVSETPVLGGNRSRSFEPAAASCRCSSTSIWPTTGRTPNSSTTARRR